MSAQIIILDNERRRRADRASASDLLVIAAVCCWPISWTWLVARAAIGITAAAWGSRS